MRCYKHMISIDKPLYLISSLENLYWWLEGGLHSGKKSILEPPSIMNGVATHGMWSDCESKDHINIYA